MKFKVLIVFMLLLLITGCSAGGNQGEEKNISDYYEEYSVEEIFDKNDNVVFESSEEETLLFHRVLNDFLSTLGKGKQISATPEEKDDEKE